MKLQLRMAAAAVLAAGLVVSNGFAEDAPSKAKTRKPAVKKVEKKSVTSVEEQIQKLRTDLEGQINGLKGSLAEKDAQLKQAQQSASDAQAAAAKAQEAANAQQQSVTDNAAAVNTLQSTVSDMKATNLSIVSTLSDETAALKKAVTNPTSLHYKGITLTPGGFMAFESVYRQKATGADIPTDFGSIPFDGASQASLSEFNETGRQSRISLMAEGKAGGNTYRGYVEADFLGVSTASNANQSNSYAMRQRVVWAQALIGKHFEVRGGQMWSLTAERGKALSNLTSDVKTPQTIDPNYVTGFVWTRQPGIDFIWTGKKLSYGFAVENAQTKSANSCSAGQCIWGTSAAQSSSYNAVNATYSYNMAPDLIGKVAFDPGWGHYEVFGLGRFTHYTRYPNYNSTTVSTTSGREVNSISMGGVGGSLRAPVFGKYGDFGFSGLYGYGVGRYGQTGLNDVVFIKDGHMDALEGASGLATLELHPTPRLVIYQNFGEDFVGRLLDSTGSGYAPRTANNSGCGTSVLPTSATSSTSPSNCTGSNKFVQESVTGFWYDFYKGAAGRVRFGASYSYVKRGVWGGVTSQADAEENMFHTSFRYYLP